MNSSSILFALIAFCAIYNREIHGSTQTPLTDDQKYRIACYLSCNKGDYCPPGCPQVHISPWGKRSSDRSRFLARRLYTKRAFDQSSEFQGLSFDDYGWFMKLLGRVDRK